MSPPERYTPSAAAWCWWRPSRASDITYRLYDYGRGRELHIEDGFAAIKLNTRAGKVVRQAGDDPNLLVRSPFFEVEKMKLTAPLDGFGVARFAAYHRRD